MLCDRQSSDDGENPSLVVGPHTAPPLSGGDASSPSADTSVAITGGRDGSALGGARGVGDGDDSLESRLRHASGIPCARQSLDDGANHSRFAGPHTAPMLSGFDVPTAGVAATIVSDRNSLTMRAERGEKGDDAQWRQLATPPVAENVDWRCNGPGSRRHLHPQPGRRVAARLPAARRWSCKWRQLFESLFLISLAFRAKTLALGRSRAAAAQRARPQRHYHGRETTGGKLGSWRNWCFPREEG